MRLGPVVHVGAAEAPGVSELHADEQPVVRTCGTHVLLDENAAQAGQASTRVLGGDNLIGIGPAVVAHRHGLAAPDQFCATAAKALPSPDREFAGTAVRRTIPAFHGLDRNGFPRECPPTL
jgi:hypothetical protein